MFTSPNPLLQARGSVVQLRQTQYCQRINRSAPIHRQFTIQALGKIARQGSKFPEAICNIHATFNNTIITYATPDGRKLCQSSGGAVGFKNARKSSPYAAKVAAEAATEVARKTYGVRTLIVKVAGAGQGREAAIRALAGMGMVITVIKDVTPIPHNGCRPPKKARK